MEANQITEQLPLLSQPRLSLSSFLHIPYFCRRGMGYYKEKYNCRTNTTNFPKNLFEEQYRDHVRHVSCSGQVNTV